MKLLGYSLVVLAALSAGCSSKLATPAANASTEASEPREIDQASDPTVLGADVEVAATATLDHDRRAVGDYVTFAFSGSYRKAPLKLTQRVTARSHSAITIDYGFQDAKRSDTLRVTFSTEPTSRGTVLSVLRVGADGTTTVATPADFELKMAETAAITDQNEALIDETTTQVKVGETQVPATRSRFKVKIGQKSATLETTTSEAFAWGDLGGKITTADGKVFYSAEIVDAGAAQGARAALEP